MDSARNLRRFENWEILYDLNWEKFPRTYSVRPAPSTGQKDCEIVFAGYVSGLRKNRSARERNNLKSCQFLFTL